MRSLRVASLLTLVGLLPLASRSDDARAAWPPAPGADLRDQANWPNDPDYADLWQYWSWLPTQEKGSRPYTAADVALGASGMSVDKAWTLSTGRADVRIAVIDSGIQWEEEDLLEKAYLNPGELTGDHKPKTAAGGVCGGGGALAGYDCNGDGVFSVADYRDDPRIAPVVPGHKCFGSPERVNLDGPDTIRGDVNRNCVLDPGDVIQLFSDGVDDDGNGYTDDVSGWDFFKNDNDPYDDTRYGHGTGEAKDSAAAGNDGKGTIGVCPGCRFELLRAGDSFIADANDFAKAVVYATDTGASVVQEALGTVDQTPFSKAAIDYAYAHDVTVVASMADENSRHHNLPATTNHVLTVHAISYDGSSKTTSSTFLGFNTCTNYGGQLSLSVSGTGCSSEATGRTAGVVGLVYSMAASQSPPLKLHAEEVIQLLKATADDIDVAESRSADPEVASRFYESKPGWDQRFGYGRENAYRALAAIEEGLLPPEVDITAPAWFAPIHADRTGPVAIVGRVAAARASSYDYAVEWAPGVEPDDAAFQPLGAPVTNVPPATVSGGGAPLATFDPSALDTAHAPDRDSPNHENDRTVTLRVRAIAHYAKGDVRGEARRTIAITNAKNGLDADLLPGFPIALGGSNEASPKLADLDGDGVREIVLATAEGLVHAYTMKSGLPAELPGFPFATSRIDGLTEEAIDGVPRYLGSPAYTKGIDPATAREAIVGAPAVADVNGDGKPEIAIATWPGTIYLIDAKGRSLAGWPKRLPLVPSCPLNPDQAPGGPCMDITHGLARGAYAAPVLVDMDKDGRAEVIQAAFDGNIYVWHADGTPLDGWPVAVHSPKARKTNRILTTPAVTDFNGDGIPDLLTGSNEEIGKGGGSGPVFVVDGRGTKAPAVYLPNWPVTVPSIHLFPLVAEGIDSSPATADFDGDGRPDALLQGNGAPPLLLAGDPGAQVGANDPPNKLPIVDGRRGFAATSVFGDVSVARPDTMLPLFSQPSIADLDQDGTPDAIMSGGSLRLAGTVGNAGSTSTTPFQHLLAMWSGKTGQMMPGAPIVLEDYTFLTSQAVADLNGDDYPEVITGSGGYFVHAVDGCGHEPAGWPKLTNGWILATPAVGDVDGDHALEVVTGTRDGYLFAWHTRGRDDGVIAWESFHHDNANTGDYGRPLDQGTPKRAATPLVCARPETPETPAPVDPNAGRYDAGGCAAAPAPVPRSGAPRSATLFAGIAAAAALLRARRPRRACKSGVT